MLWNPGPLEMGDALYQYFLAWLIMFHRSPKMFTLYVLIVIFLLLADGIDRWRNGAR